jgi:hypothetical protein
MKMLLLVMKFLRENLRVMIGVDTFDEVKNSKYITKCVTLILINLIRNVRQMDYAVR